MDIGRSSVIYQKMVWFRMILYIRQDLHLHAFACICCMGWPIPSNTHGIIGDEHPAMPAILLFTGGFCAGLVTVENMVARYGRGQRTH